MLHLVGCNLELEWTYLYYVSLFYERTDGLCYLHEINSISHIILFNSSAHLYNSVEIPF